MIKKLSAITVLFVACVVIVGCGPRCDVEQYRDDVQPYIDEWDDALAIANSSARINLSGPIGEMQRIKRETESLEIEPCLEEVHANLISYMDGTIDGFIAFMSQENDNVVQDMMETAALYLDRYIDALSELSADE